MPKAYWIACYRSVSDPDALAAYAKLAGPAIAAGGGRFLARGSAAQAYEDGLRFVQFYFGLPLAMIVISAVFVPIYYRLKVLTAYEYLEHRFDVRVRSLNALADRVYLRWSRKLAH